jgi:hypothetical protein
VKTAPKPARPQLPAPALKSPAADLTRALQKGFVFAWERAEKAISYHLQISRDAAFTESELDSRVTINAYGYTPKQLGNYSWRVSAIGTDGKEGAWSEVRRFRVLPSTSEDHALLPPLPKTPANEAIVPGGKDVVLIWRQTSEVPTYHLQIARDADFKQLTLEQDSSANIQSLKKPAPGKYHWRVRGTDGTRTSDWSYVYTFTVQ